MCREARSDDHNGCVLRVRTVAEEIVLRKGDVEIRTTVGILREETLWLWPALVVVRGVEPFYTIFSRVCHALTNGIICIRVGARDKYRAWKTEC